MPLDLCRYESVTNLRFISLPIFLKIHKKNRDSSPNFFVRISAIQTSTLSIYYRNTLFLFSFSSPFSIFFLFFYCFLLKFWSERQVLPLFYCSILGHLENKRENWNQFFFCLKTVWTDFKYKNTKVGCSHKRYCTKLWVEVWFVCGDLNNSSNRKRRIIPLRYCKISRL